jgi:hypothetical protein
LNNRLVSSCFALRYESNLSLLASLLADRANYLNPEELYIHHSVGLKHFIEVLTYCPGDRVGNRMYRGKEATAPT